MSSIIERLKRADAQNAQSAIWILDDMPDSEEGHNSDTAEPLAKYYKRFTSCVDVAESQLRTPVPTAAATNETKEKTSRDKLRTCVFFLQKWIQNSMKG
jgi:hypothetical protein